MCKQHNFHEEFGSFADNLKANYSKHTLMVTKEEANESTNSHKDSARNIITKK